MRVPALLLSLAACTEYNVDKKADPPPDTGGSVEDSAGGAPDVAASPAAVDLGLTCGGTGAAVVRVRNDGTAALHVSSVEVTGAAWSVEPVAATVLAPGEVLDVAVRGGPGEGTLTIRSDDPDEPALEVPLAVRPDQPPTVTILDPSDGSVLAADAAVTFTGLVADDVDAPTDLDVTWASSVDGALAAGPTSPGGETTAAWDPAVRTPGAHVVTLSATDACGQTAETALSLCQDQGYSADSLDLSTWNFEGSARWDATNGWVELTAALNDQSGTAFQTASTVGAENVSIAFRFYVSGGSGADGISVTALDTTRMTGFVGSTGGGIGYAGLPGWSIEVDTWYNSEYGDPTSEDHVSIHFDGEPYGPAAWAALPDMEDGAWHDMEVDVLAPHVTVRIDGVVYIDTDLSGFTSFPAYVGFTAATGGATNQHLIDALTVTRYVCEE